MNRPATRYAALSLAVILVVTCTPLSEITTGGSAIPTESPAASQGGTDTPALTSRSADTATETPTTLPPEGPYFAFAYESAEGPVVTFVGRDGLGRKEIPLPASADLGDCFPCIVSPDGKQVAYWMGATGDSHYPEPIDRDGPFDLTLNLLRTADGTSAQIADLLSPGYPDDFLAAAEDLKDLPEFEGYDPGWFETDLYYAFASGMTAAAWSPDGRRLAFSAQTDGPTSDLYAYDASDGAVRRLSADGTFILSISEEPPVLFSPGGDWIVYSRGYFSFPGSSVVFSAVRADGSAVRDFPHELVGFVDWLSDEAFTVTNGANVIGYFDLERNDLATGATSDIWGCPYEKYVLDPEGLVFVHATSTAPPEWDCPEPGYYIRRFPSGTAQRVFEIPEDCRRSRMVFLGQGDRRFLVTFCSTTTYAVASDGGKQLLLEEPLLPSVSPDGRWTAFFGEGLRIMDSSGDISDRITDAPVEDVYWRPDSKGLLLRSGEDIYSVSLPDMTAIRWEGVIYPERAEWPYWQPDSQGFFVRSGTDLLFLSLRDRSLEVIQQVPYGIAFDPVWVALPG